MAASELIVITTISPIFTVVISRVIVSVAWATGGPTAIHKNNVRINNFRFFNLHILFNN